MPFRPDLYLNPRQISVRAFSVTGYGRGPDYALRVADKPLVFPVTAWLRLQPVGISRLDNLFCLITASRQTPSVTHHFAVRLRAMFVGCRAHPPLS